MDDVKLEEGWIEKARMPKVEDAFKILLKEANGKYAVGAWVLGPFTLGGQVIELDLLLKGAARERARVEAFMDTMTDAVIAVAKRYQALGVDYMNIREMGSGTDLLSPPHVETADSAVSEKNLLRNQVPEDPSHLWRH